MKRDAHILKEYRAFWIIDKNLCRALGPQYGHTPMTIRFFCISDHQIYY